SIFSRPGARAILSRWGGSAAREMILRVSMPLVAMAVLTAAAAQPAQAQLLTAWRDCVGDRGVAPAQQIDGCSGVILSADETPTRRAVAQFNRGALYQGQGAIDRAMADYVAAARLDPGLAEAFAGRGSASFAAGDYARAVADYDRAVQLKPDDARLLTGRAAARAAHGDRAGALADYDRAVELAPGSAEILTQRGQARASFGDEDRALADFNRVLAQFPDFAPALANRGALFARKGQL